MLCRGNGLGEQVFDIKAEPCVCSDDNVGQAHGRRP